MDLDCKRFSTLNSTHSNVIFLTTGVTTYSFSNFLDFGKLTFLSWFIPIYFLKGTNTQFFNLFRHCSINIHHYSIKKKKSETTRQEIFESLFSFSNCIELSQLDESQLTKRRWETGN